jgi:hypothetical protein
MSVFLQLHCPIRFVQFALQILVVSDLILKNHYKHKSMFRKLL